jgi:hypothetical protein
LRQIAYAEKQIISYFKIVGTNKKEVVRIFLGSTAATFIPSTVKEWNKLDIAIRKLDSLSKFKNAIRLNSQSNKISVPKLYYSSKKK